MEESKRYTLSEVAEKTNMSVAFWRKRMRLRELEVERFGRSIRVTQSALDRYLAHYARTRQRAA
ncbi:MAG: helix-turn-helix domain-containing protein [Bryobacteraceae bacterium]|jgi:excisionase family DNA binding protein